MALNAKSLLFINSGWVHCHQLPYNYIGEMLCYLTQKHAINDFALANAKCRHISNKRSHLASTLQHKIKEEHFRIELQNHFIPM